MEDELKILKVEYLSNHCSDLLQTLNLNLGDQSKMKKLLEMKTTSKERCPQNIKSRIQQPLIGSSSNFKLKPMGPNKN